MTVDHDAPALGVIERCFAGAVPAVLCTASADGVPNVTFISKAMRVDDERIAVSNQFMSKTARNLAANPLASLLLVDPVTSDEFRLSLVYERTERRGHVFDRLRHDVDVVAELAGMQDVFRLRAATIFRVVDLARIEPHPSGSVPGDEPSGEEPALTSLAALAARIGRCTDLDVLLDTTLDGLDQLLGFRHVHLLLLDEEGHRLYTIASRGFDEDSVGAEVVVGEGHIGVAAARCEPVRIGNLRQMDKYSRSIARRFEESGGSRPGPELRMPGLPGANSRLVVPVMSLGQLVGVVVADSGRPAAFGAEEEHVVGVVGTMLGTAIEHVRALERQTDEAPVAAAAAPVAPDPVGVTTDVRFFEVDASTFLDGEYLIKGVAGRILWSLLRQHAETGRVEFTNRELRLDPGLQLPGFKDNLESRLILLKRRLDERGATIRLERTGRGRFRLDVAVPVRLQGDG